MKKYIKENKKIFLGALLSIAIIVLILTVILFMRVNEESNTEKFNNMVIAAIENIKQKEIKKDYILVEFPDDKKIITKNGKLVLSNGKKYSSFKEGYIIRYSDGSYAFKLSNGSYCATKDYNESSVSIDLNGTCEDFEIEYK